MTHACEKTVALGGAPKGRQKRPARREGAEIGYVRAAETDAGDEDGGGGDADAAKVARVLEAPRARAAVSAEPTRDLGHM